MSFDSNKEFSLKFKTKNALNSTLNNLDVRDVAIRLNESVSSVFNIYKVHNRMSFSETLNNICERNLNKLEKIHPKSYNKWLIALNDYISISSLNKNFSNVMVDYLYIPNNNNIYKSKQFHFVMDVDYINRIDNLKNNLIFKNSSRDMIITYLMSFDDFEDINDIFRMSVKELFNPYLIEINRCTESIEQNCVKINKLIINYILNNGFIKPDTALLLNYINESLNLYKSEIKINKKFVENVEFKETIINIKNLLEEQEPILKKMILNESYEVLKYYVKNINNKIEELDNLIETHKINDDILEINELISIYDS